MTRMRRIYVDFDDILCETAEDLIVILQEEFGKTVIYEDLHDFNLGVSFSLDREELKRFFAVAHRPESILRIKPMSGAKEALRTWTNDGFKVCIVTGRPTSTRASSIEWLTEHDFPYSEIVFVDKYRRATPDSDAVTLDEISRQEYLFAVDDAPPMLNFIIDKMTAPVLVLDRPWNRCVEADDERVFRGRSWEDILKIAKRWSA